jgi:hypothetical protein
MKGVRGRRKGETWSWVWGWGFGDITISVLLY